MKTVQDIAEYHHELMRIKRDYTDFNKKEAIKQIFAFQNRKADIIIESFRQNTPNLQLMTSANNNNM